MCIYMLYMIYIYILYIVCTDIRYVYTICLNIHMSKKHDPFPVMVETAKAEKNRMPNGLSCGFSLSRSWEKKNTKKSWNQPAWHGDFYQSLLPQFLFNRWPQPKTPKLNSYSTWVVPTWSAPCREGRGACRDHLAPSSGSPPGWRCSWHRPRIQRWRPGRQKNPRCSNARNGLNIWRLNASY